MKEGNVICLQSKPHTIQCNGHCYSSGGLNFAETLSDSSILGNSSGVLREGRIKTQPGTFRRRLSE